MPKWIPIGFQAQEEAQVAVEDEVAVAITNMIDIVTTLLQTATIQDLPLLVKAEIVSLVVVRRFSSIHLVTHP